jgi:hypothetical protein
MIARANRKIMEEEKQKVILNIISRLSYSAIQLPIFHHRLIYYSMMNI